ncbi:MAG: hypothetical protein WBB36_01905, partial [Chitinophagales bacterium]
PINGLLGLHKGEAPMEHSDMMMQTPVLQAGEHMGSCCTKPSKSEAITTVAAISEPADQTTVVTTTDPVITTSDQNSSSGSK